MKIYNLKCLFIGSNEVSNDTVMIRLRKDTYSRVFLWRLISGVKHISIIFHFLSPCPKLVAQNTDPNQECLWTRECKSPQQIWTQLRHNSSHDYWARNFTYCLNTCYHRNLHGWSFMLWKQRLGKGLLPSWDVWLHGIRFQRRFRLWVWYGRVKWKLVKESVTGLPWWIMSGWTGLRASLCVRTA